jgi:hypothetical protein
MRLALIVFALTGCSVFHDARDEFRKEVTGLQSEFARLNHKENSNE